MKHELKMLHEFNTLPLTLEYDAGSPHREPHRGARGDAGGMAVAGPAGPAVDGVENLLCMHDAYTDPDDGCVCLVLEYMNEVGAPVGK